DLATNFAFTGSALTLNGSGNTVGGTFEVTNGGTFTTADAADVTVVGEFIQNGVGSSVIGADLTSSADGFSFATNVTLSGTDAIRIQTGEGAGDDVVITGTLTGVDDDLTLDAGGSGNVTLTGAVNLGTGSLTIVDANQVVFGSTLSAASFTQSAGTTSTTIGGVLTLTGVFDFTGSALTISGSGTNDVDGSMTVTNAGVFTLSENAVLTPGGAFVQNGAGSNVIGENITGGSSILFTRAVVLTSGVADDVIVFTSGGGAGQDITFSSTLDNADNESVTFDAGAAGDITVSGALGDLGTGDIRVVNAADVTFSATVDADNFTQVAGTGTTTFSGVLDLATNFAFTGNALTIVGIGTSVIDGTMTVTNAG
ncbi:MAG: hypothetical protein EBY43_10165, partial [Opitutae bacterium]|nr:hypothetical protein [Opitutae bacterium]